MAIFYEHEKKEQHFGSVSRTRKRITNLLFILGVVFLIIGIVSLVKGETTNGLMYLMASLGWVIPAFILAYRITISPRKNTLFTDVLKDYSDRRIINQLSELGLKKNLIDVILNPNGSIIIAYSYNGNIYYSVELYQSSYDFDIKATPEFVSKLDYYIYKNHILKGSKKRIKTTKTKGINKNDFYLNVSELFKNSNDELKLFINICNDAYNEHKEKFN